MDVQNLCAHGLYWLALIGPAPSFVTMDSIFTLCNFYGFISHNKLANITFNYDEMAFLQYRNLYVPR